MAREKPDIPYEFDEDSVFQVHRGGVAAVSYDFLEPGEAEVIATLLNRGVGPDWDALKPEFEKAMRERKRKRRKAP